MALINYARKLATIAGLSLTLAFNLGSWAVLALTLGCSLPLTFALALSQPLPAWRALVHN